MTPRLDPAEPAHATAEPIESAGRRAAVDPDADLLPGLRSGDPAAYAALVDRAGPMLLGLIRVHVRDERLAEDVLQETWIGIVRGIDRFEARASLRTWCARIALNIARSSAVREARQLPFSTVVGAADGDDRPAVDPERFEPGGRWAGHWISSPRRWDGLPEERLLAGETLAVVRSVVEQLPARQREVLLLRDVEGWSGPEVCNALGLTAIHQRVLLHRARSSVRRALETHLETDRA